mmetsp:Transcript_63352/g.182305  ORF Transcript_63352/g.182305 Transcript_63352/m.182305 type:complete len:261 (+) Transcript_63352:1037-1819(+)
MVMTPGYEGDSYSSSQMPRPSTFKATAVSSRPNVARTRSQHLFVFSCGGLIFAGSRKVSYLPRSVESTATSTMHLSSAPARSRTTTISTTRTSFLCAVASNMSRASPLRTSSAKVFKLFEEPAPNLLGSIPCSCNIVENNVRSVASRPSCAKGAAFASRSKSPDEETRPSSHQSYASFVPGRFLLSTTKGWKSRPCTGRTVVPFEPVCSWCKRSISSPRRSLMPTFAPSSRIISGTFASEKASSCGASCAFSFADVMLPR